MPTASGRKRATIVDIARMANVSTATVSRVLNNSDYPVSETLRARILAVAEQYEYRPNIFGQMLKGGVNQVIGIMVPTMTNPFYTQLLAEIERRCIASGYAPFICSSHNDPDLETKLLDMLRRHQVAGIILSSANVAPEFVRALGDGRTPCVLFEQPLPAFSGSSVGFDFCEAGRMACRHLVETGHRRIAFAASALDKPSRKDRFEGYCAALAEAGLGQHRDLVVLPAGRGASEGELQDYQHGRLLAKEILSRPKLPDAVQAINDITAIGMMNVFRERKVHVPQDVSIIGFDDITFASMVTPLLTTVRQSTSQTAELAVEILLKLISGGTEKPTRAMVKPEFVGRDSVRMCRRRAEMRPMKA